MVSIDAALDPSRHAPGEHGDWVVGIDGSACATNALDWAVANAPGRATGLELVTAWQIPVVNAGAAGGSVMMPVDDMEVRTAAANDVEDLADRARGELSVPVIASIAQGGPAAVLLDAAKYASMLVVGSRGRGGFSRLLLGSTSTQCATHTSVPTIVVPDQESPAVVERIVVGFDGSANSMAALRWAIHFAAPGTTVVVVWIWDATPLAVGADAFFFPDASDLAAERFEHLVESVAAEATAAEVLLQRQFVRGAPRSSLIEAAEGVDLLVVGARGHGAIGFALLGSVSTWLLHHARIPVAIIPFDVADDAADDGAAGASTRHC